MFFICNINLSAQDTFVSVGIHPGANAQTTSTGKQISVLFPWKGKLYAGYGDYGANTGPIDIYSFDPDSQVFNFVWEANTEAIYNYRAFNGKVFAPAIDRKSYSKPGDYTMLDTNGVWADYNFSGSSSTHVYDAAQLNDTLIYMVGSQDERAAVWESKDCGNTWKTIHYDTAISGNPNDFARYYFAGSYQNKLYVQATDYYGSLHPYSEVWDGVEWKHHVSLFGSSTFAHGLRPDTFANKLIYLSPQYGTPGYASPFRVFDGTTATVLNNMWVIDFIVDSNYLYALVDSGFGTIHVKRTADLITWNILARAPYGCKSLAIMDDRIYLGMANAEIMQSSSRISDLITNAVDEPIDKIILYPNPCNDVLNIIIPAGREMAGTLFDSSGRILLKQQLMDDVNRMDISSLSPGMYLLRLENNCSFEIRTFIKI